MSVRTRLFRSNRSQAVRLPKAVELPASVSEVSVTAVGTSRVISPVDLVWDQWFDEPAVSDDFLPQRDQPQDQDREPL
jgi:antitoxin VapB